MGLQPIRKKRRVKNKKTRCLRWQEMEKILEKLATAIILLVGSVILAPVNNIHAFGEGFGVGL